MELSELKLCWTIGSMHPISDMLEGDKYQDFRGGREGDIHMIICNIIIVFELSESMACFIAFI